VLLAGLQGSLGQPAIIDNKAGVNGNLAAADVMKAPPDGDRLQSALVLAVPASSPIKTYAQFVEHVKTKGSSPAITDLIGGRLDARFDATSVVAPFIKSG
jgi:tripartite-type tricarboxylate transporter receptor subunit TctC